MNDLPPSEKARKYEIRALGLREFAGLKKDSQRLDPFDLAQYANLFVARFEDVSAFLSEETIEHLTGGGKDKWSGGAASHALPDGRKLIILNPTHSSNRHAATLMEEISHVFMGHKPSKLAITSVNKQGKEIAREYQADVEEEAYSVGAAALVPYTALRKMINQGKTSNEIARHFRVSRDLVEFRMRITHLWEDYKKMVLT